MCETGWKEHASVCLSTFFKVCICHSECVKSGGDRVNAFVSACPSLTSVCVCLCVVLVECVKVCVCVCETADDGWAGRMEQGTMNEVTDRDG